MNIPSCHPDERKPPHPTHLPNYENIVVSLTEKETEKKKMGGPSPPQKQYPPRLVSFRPSPFTQPKPIRGRPQRKKRKKAQHHDPDPTNHSLTQPSSIHPSQIPNRNYPSFLIIKFNS
jgi:hypothetical protein